MPEGMERQGMTGQSAGAEAETPPETASALLSLALVAQHHGRSIRPEEARRRGGIAGPLNAAALAQTARRCGFRADARLSSMNELLSLRDVFPVLALLRNGETVVVLGVAQRADGPMIGVFDVRATPAGAMDIDPDRFDRAWSGELVFLKPRLRLTDENRPFGLGWFGPELLRRSGDFRDVALAALALHGLALAVPIYTQIVIDKVLTHHAVATLTTLTVGVTLALGFEAAFRFLRQYVLLTAANRIDIRLLNRTFGRLLRLPVDFFDRRPAGVTVRHMQQVEQIREFFTGRLLSTLLDAAALPVLLPLLAAYSGALTGLVAGFALVTAAAAAALAPLYRRRLQDLYEAEAERQAMLVETIHGMRTIKSAAMEGLQEQAWDRRAAQSVAMHFRVGRVALTAQSIMEFLEKAMGVAVIAVGAFLVFDGRLSVGALIAFQMLSGRVTAPLVQIVGLINRFQETQLSVRMLGEVMNHPVEPQRDAGATPLLTGGVILDGVGHRYDVDRPPALTGVSWRIPPGSVVGVVGRSGSGKSTLVRLLQGFHRPGEGRILLDAVGHAGGVDLRELDLGHLRRSIGVVLQDNFLFRGSIRENIAMSAPGASPDAVLRAAKLAGADEFVARLPHGYETRIEEGGANLSGGQRQRIAIARALLPEPRLLIFDEATSALDPDSEAAVMDNLAAIAHGRTVIIVTHRLSTLTGCDAVAVLEEGRLIAAAPHPTLLRDCDIYRHLWRRQNRSEPQP
jgi:ATP-binding cassette, subfamily B, bacterial HlyB/CyaB